MDSDKFRRHFSVPGAMWFSAGMETFFMKANGRTGKFNLDAFRDGGEGKSRSFSSVYIQVLPVCPCLYFCRSLYLLFFLLFSCLRIIYLVPRVFVSVCLCVSLSL